MPTVQRLTLGSLQLTDARGLWTPSGSAARLRDPASLVGIAVHHDGVVMPPGDQDYDRETLAEDLGRLTAIHNRAVDQGWGSFPYHFVASPNGRTFYTLDVAYFGAHVASQNHLLLGVALMGDFTAAPPSDAQLCAAGRAIAAIWHLTDRLLLPLGHRDWALPPYPTSCPGDTYFTWKDRLLDISASLARHYFP